MIGERKMEVFMKKLRRILSFILIFSMIFLIFPEIRIKAADPGPITLYQPQKLEYGLLNRATSENKAFYDTYVKATSDFNTIDAFGLSYDEKYVRTTGTYEWHMGSNSAYAVLDSLREKGDLYVNYRATLYNIMHRSLKNHPVDKLLAYPITTLEQTFYHLAGLYNISEVTGHTTLGDNSFVWVNSRKNVNTFTLKMLVGGCKTCGNCEISKLSMAFADMKGPELDKEHISIFTTSDAAGNNKDATFKPGQTVYIHLKFDEYIRFSDNSANHDNVKLNLKISSTENNQEIKGHNQQAELYSLKDKTLTFKYTVPETLGGGNTNHFISGIDGYQPDLFGSSGNFKLVLLGKNGRVVALDGNMSGDNALTKTSSLITDLAGNPALWPANGMDLDTKCRIDNTAPIITDVNITATGNPDGSVYVGPGSTLSFMTVFSETLDISDVSSVYATLNIKNKSGNFVTVDANSISNDGRTVTFAPLTITSDMTPVKSSRGEYFACLESITFPEGVNDLCGNPYGGNMAVPDKKFYADTAAPTATTSITPLSGKYTPVGVDSGTSSGFCFPFRVFDTNEDGEEYVSGTDPVGVSTALKGSFSWVNNERGGGQYRFLYCITGSAALNSSESFSEGSTGQKYAFDQVTPTGGGELYIHIRLLDSELLLEDEGYNISDSSIVLCPVDYVGNTGQVDFPLGYVADDIGPSYTQTGYSTAYNGADKTGSITVGIRAIDPSLINTGAIFYQWIPSSNSPDDNLWVQYTGAGESAASVELSITLPGLAPGTNHEYDLHIMATDLRGNTSSAKFSYINDLSFPAYGVETSGQISQNPTFTITAPQINPYDGGHSSMLVMIKDPLGATGNEYFVRTINSTSYSGSYNGDILSEFIWGDLHPIDNMRAWRYTTVIRDSDYIQYNGERVSNVQYGFTNAKNLAKMRDTVEDEAIAQRLYAMMGGMYYGEIEITLITGYGATGRDVWEPVDGTTCIYELNAHNKGNFVTEAAYFYDDWQSDKYGYYYDKECTIPVPRESGPDIAMDEHTGYYVSYIPQNANIISRTWTLKAASRLVVLAKLKLEDGNFIKPNGTEINQYYEPDIHEITIKPTSNLNYNDGWSNPDNGLKYLDSIDGAEIEIEIKNLIEPGWGVEDVNFDSSNTYLSLQLISSPDPDAKPGELYSVKLRPLSKQTFKIPAGVAVYTGRYAIWLDVEAKASGKTIHGSFSNIYVDRTGIGEFGLAKVESSMTGPLFDKTTETWYGYDKLAKPDAFYQNPSLSLGSNATWPVASLNHKLYFTTISSGLEGGGHTYQNLHIKVWNATEGIDEAVSKAAATWVPIKSECNDYYTARMVGSAEHVMAGYGYCVIPLIRGQENILNYQIVSSNGKSSEVRTLLVNVSDELAQLEIGLSPEASEVSLTSASAFVEKLSSDTYSSMEAYCYDGINHIPVNEAINITSNGDYWFYALNAHGQGPCAAGKI
jgi:hypothetical protein